MIGTDDRAATNLQTIFERLRTPRSTVSGQTKYGLTPLKPGKHPEDTPCRCVYCSPGQRPLRGKISQRRLREHCERMGIKLPVRIQIDRGLAGEREQGNHHMDPTKCSMADALRAAALGTSNAPGMEHIIKVNPDLSAENANRTVLHELRHAEQREKGGIAMMSEYNACDRAYGYHDNPWEIDAELAAQQFGHLPPIVVA